MVVLDTHVVVWWSGEPRRLGHVGAARLAAEDRLGIPTIVFWEVALLVRKRKLDLGMPVAAWTQAIQTIPRVQALPLTAEIAVLADGLEMHADPADRFIAVRRAAARRTAGQQGPAHACPTVRRNGLVAVRPSRQR